VLWTSIKPADNIGPRNIMSYDWISVRCEYDTIAEFNADWKAHSQAHVAKKKKT